MSVSDCPICSHGLPDGILSRPLLIIAEGAHSYRITYGLTQKTYKICDSRDEALVVVRGIQSVQFEAINKLAGPLHTGPTSTFNSLLIQDLLEDSISYSANVDHVIETGADITTTVHRGFLKTPETATVLLNIPINLKEERVPARYWGAIQETLEASTQDTYAWYDLLAVYLEMDVITDSLKELDCDPDTYLTTSMTGIQRLGRNIPLSVSYESISSVSVKPSEPRKVRHVSDEPLDSVLTVQLVFNCKFVHDCDQPDWREDF